MKLVPSTRFAPLTINADPAAYNKLGSEFPRGDGRRVLRRSDLVSFAKSPRKWILGTRDKDTDSKEWGDLIDTLIITPERFDEKFAICPAQYPAKAKKGEAPELKPWNRNADHCKQWEAEQEKTGKWPIKFGTLADARIAVKRIQEEPELVSFIESSRKQVQVCMDYTDAKTGVTVTLKCLIDLVPSGDFRLSLCDLKTTSDASLPAWVRKVNEMGYDAQAALYLDAWNAATGEKRHTFYHLVQESEPPYEPAFWMLSEEFLQIGRGKYQAALEEYIQCLQSRNWPGYERLARWGVVEPTKWMQTEFPAVEVAA